MSRHRMNGDKLLWNPQSLNHAGSDLELRDHLYYEELKFGSARLLAAMLGEEEPRNKPRMKDAWQVLGVREEQAGG